MSLKSGRRARISAAIFIIDGNCGVVVVTPSAKSWLVAR